MKKVILLILISITLLSACAPVSNTNQSTYIHMPHEIIFYHNGDEIIIGGESKGYETLLSLIDKVIADTENVGMMKSIIRNPNEQKVKSSEYALELIYCDAIKTSLMINGRRETIVFSKVFIPLDSNTIFIGIDEGYSNRGISVSFIPKELVVALLDVV
ncbi:hypothetical protein [Natronincola ferrireducens]|uniref:Uncharacterized protein n=1 Tax=Natronincola ferrireducens TaxID=393762 RepID=A0A1G8ZZS4_9FIRM|nr:hypothetical protein [Natronincola ferrireducens]SDK20608.1 hypothetical protein SAMN05660472_01018 [Natronincola ferrireducens]